MAGNKCSQENHTIERTAKSFKPISLSSYLLKGKERTILWHLKETTLKTEPINKEVYSYKEGVSTENAIQKVTYLIEHFRNKDTHWQYF